MNNKSAAVSVIIPCYRSARTLNRAVESIYKQTLLPKEIIFVDDASDDKGETRSCIQRIISEKSKILSVKLSSIFLEKNIGPAGARNIAWNQARNPYIAFLDADDTWMPEKIAIQYQWMRENPRHQVTCHESCHDSSLFMETQGFKTSVLCSNNLLFRNYISTRTVMLANDKTYQFDPSFRYAEDYFLWLLMSFSGIKIVKINLCLASSYKRDFGEGGLSKDLGAMHKGVKQAFKQLFRLSLIGKKQYFLACIWENIKYVRRRFIRLV